MELNSGLEEREEETHRLSSQVSGNFFLEPGDFLATIFQKLGQTVSQFQVEKAAEELEEAERQEVEARREAVALQEQIEKMIQVKTKEVSVKATIELSSMIGSFTIWNAMEWIEE